MLTRRHLIGGIAAIALIPSSLLVRSPAMDWVNEELGVWRTKIPSHLEVVPRLIHETIIVVGRNRKTGRELGFSLSTMFDKGRYESIIGRAVPKLAELLTADLSADQLESLGLAV